MRSNVSHARESSLQSTGGGESNLIGRLVRVSLPHNQKTVVPVKPGVTVYELLIHCCKKRKLDPKDHFIRIKTVTTPTNMNDPNLSGGHGNENNSLGLRWTIPPYKSKLEDLDCREIQLCIKEYHSMQLIRRSNERFGIEYETVQECNGNSRNEPRLFVVDVIQGSIAEVGGMSSSWISSTKRRIIG